MCVPRTVEVVEPTPVSVSMDALLVGVADLLQDPTDRNLSLVARIMLAEVEIDGRRDVLYRHVLCNLVSARGRDSVVAALERAIIDNMPDQDHVQSFCSFLASPSQDVVQLRVTPHMARSFYAAVARRGRSEEIAQLSNVQKAWRLHKAMQVLEVDVDIDEIRFCSYDGYTVCVAAKQQAMLQGIHEQEKNSFYLTREMGSCIYEEVGARYGIRSREYQHMQSLNNECLEPIEDPWNPQGPRLSVPPKMFYALKVLNIRIPEWEFNSVHGYIVSSPQEQRSLRSFEDIVAQRRQLQVPPKEQAAV